jgi:addiction module RelE/StbE family toxin
MTRTGMTIRRSKRFMARYRRLSFAHKQAVIEAIETLRNDPSHASLANHALRGAMARQRAISVDHDLRIVFAVKGDYEEILFLDIGTHADVYRE